MSKARPAPPGPRTRPRPVLREADGDGRKTARQPLLREVIGRVLRRERIAQQRTLSDVAADAQVSTPYLSEIERGLKESSSEILEAVCRALGLQLLDLIDRGYLDLLETRQAEELRVRVPVGFAADRRRETGMPLRVEERGSVASGGSALVLAA